MKVLNVEVEQFGSGSHPDGINADLVLDDETIIQAYRAWDKPDWFVYDILYKTPDQHVSIGLEDLERKHPIPVPAWSRALEDAIDILRAIYAPA